MNAEKTTILQEIQRQNIFPAELIIKAGAPKKVRIKTVSSEFVQKIDAEVRVKIERSINGGKSWETICEFFAGGGVMNLGPSGSGDGMCGAAFEMDGLECIVKTTLEIKKSFSCGLTCEVTDVA